MKILKYSVVFVFLLFLSCSDDQCNLDTDSMLKAELVVLDPNLSGIKFLDSLSVYSPAWSDSIYNLDDKLNSSILFKLSPASDTTQIIFSSVKGLVNDTVSFYYTRDVVFISPECGFTVNFNIDTLENTWNNIDSIVILKKDILTNEKPNIKIYF